MKVLPRFSFGVGDRFGREGVAQLRAVAAVAAKGVDIAPVWNKSNREHKLVGTGPEAVRAEADAAVKALNLKGAYFVDADHIRLPNVEAYAPCSDFFTIDVADSIGAPVADSDVADFVRRHADLVGSPAIEGLSKPISLSEGDIRATGAKYLAAIRAAGEVYRKIAGMRPDGEYSIEVSMDETSAPQTPGELLVILAGLADEKIPLQTIAPKFSGEFHKGIDYIGDPALFAAEFDADVCVARYASKAFGFPPSLKLSVHSGSDKFAIYPAIAASVKRHGVGVHVKTAGTTWLEEVAGLAAAGGDGLELAREIVLRALPRLDELSAPYAAVLSIDRSRLPSADEIRSWSGDEFVAKLVHDEENPAYSPDFRQLVHISYSIAAEMGKTYMDALERHRETIESFVTRNILDRHLKRLFPGLF